MKKIAIVGIMILISFSTLFRGLHFAYETHGFLAALAMFSIAYFIIKMKNNEPVRICKLFIFIGLALVMAAAVSFAKAVDPRENLGTLMLYGELLILFIVLYDHFYGRKQQLIKYMMMPVVLAGFACAVIGLMALTGNLNRLDVPTIDNRIGSTFQYANTASVYFVICIIFAAVLADTAGNVLLRALAAGMGSIFIYAFFLTGSRGGYLVCMVIMPIFLLLLPSAKWISSILCLLSMTVPVFLTLKGFNEAVSQHANFSAVLCLAVSFVIAAVSYGLLSLLIGIVTRDREVSMQKGIRLVLGGILAAVLIVAVFKEDLIQLLPVVMSKRLNRLIIQGFNDHNVLYRLDFSIDALKLISTSWVTGLGSGGWKAMYQSVQNYFYTAEFVHNHYFQVFVENGILGFLSFTAKVAVSLAGCIYTYVKSRNNLMLRTYTTGLLCGMAALVGHAAGDFDLSFVSLMLLLWVMFTASMTMAGEKPAGEVLDGDTSVYLVDKSKCIVRSNIVKLILVMVCFVLFALHGLFFAGAYYGNKGHIHGQMNGNMTALAYYEKAVRFDPSNAFYYFEMAKLYHYFGVTSSDAELRQTWLEKAREAGERSTVGRRDYPAYMKALTYIYLDSDMPLEALDLAQELVICQKYNSEVYEVLARSCIDAAQYYESKGDIDKARELLRKCIAIDQDPYLRRSVITKPQDIESEEKLSKYKHSDVLAIYLAEAEEALAKIE